MYLFLGVILNYWIKKIFYEVMLLLELKLFSIWYPFKQLLTPCTYKQITAYFIDQWKQTLTYEAYPSLSKFGTLPVMKEDFSIMISRFYKAKVFFQDS